MVEDLDAPLIGSSCPISSRVLVELFDRRAGAGSVAHWYGLRGSQPGVAISGHAGLVSAWVRTAQSPRRRLVSRAPTLDLRSGRGQEGKATRGRSPARPGRRACGRAVMVGPPVVGSDVAGKSRKPEARSLLSRRARPPSLGAAKRGSRDRFGSLDVPEARHRSRFVSFTPPSYLCTSSVHATVGAVADVRRYARNCGSLGGGRGLDETGSPAVAWTLIPM